MDGAPQPGGAPANLAAALARLGTPSRFAGAIGSDAAGDRVVAAIADAGVASTTLVRIDAALAATREVLVERTAEGDRRFVGFRPSGAVYADTCFPAASVATALAGTALLVVGSLGFAEAPTSDAVRAAVAEARARAIPLAVDVNLRDVFWKEPAQADDVVRRELAPFAHTMKASREEALRLFATDDPRAIAARFGMRAVLVTDGRNGCRWTVGEAHGTTAAFAVREADATGAGDAFFAGYLHATLAGEAPHDAVRFASACGAIVAAAPGAMAPQPDAARVRAFLARASG